MEGVTTRPGEGIRWEARPSCGEERGGRGIAPPLHSYVFSLQQPVPFHEDLIKSSLSLVHDPSPWLSTQSKQQPRPHTGL